MMTPEASTCVKQEAKGKASRCTIAVSVAHLLVQSQSCLEFSPKPSLEGISPHLGVSPPVCCRFLCVWCHCDSSAALFSAMPFFPGPALGVGDTWQLVPLPWLSQQTQLLSVGLAELAEHSGCAPALSVRVLLGLQCARTALSWTLPPSPASLWRTSWPRCSWPWPCTASLATTGDTPHEVRDSRDPRAVPGTSGWHPGAAASSWVCLDMFPALPMAPLIPDLDFSSFSF